MPATARRWTRWTGTRALVLDRCPTCREVLPVTHLRNLRDNGGLRVLQEWRQACGHEREALALL